MDQKKRTEIASLGQFGLIDLLTSGFTPKNASTLKGAGDDAAVIAPGRGEAVLCTTDSFYEGVDFDLTYFPLKHLGYKAVTAGVSDILAMNALPAQITVSLGVSSKLPVEALQDLYEGIAFACKEQEIDLVGGDTRASMTGLVITVTTLGYAKKEKIVYRSGAQQNDLVCITGNLGAAYMGLQLLEREKRVLADVENPEPQFKGYEYLLEKYLKPRPRTDIVRALAEEKIRPTSMIDLSDGLASDLMQICKSRRAHLPRTHPDRPADLGAGRGDALGPGRCGSKRRRGLRTALHRAAFDAGTDHAAGPCGRHRPHHPRLHGLLPRDARRAGHKAEGTRVPGRISVLPPPAADGYSERERQMAVGPLRTGVTQRDAQPVPAFAANARHHAKCRTVAGRSIGDSPFGRSEDIRPTDPCSREQRHFRRQMQVVIRNGHQAEHHKRVLRADARSQPRVTRPAEPQTHIEGSSPEIVTTFSDQAKARRIVVKASERGIAKGRPDSHLTLETPGPRITGAYGRILRLQAAKRKHGKNQEKAMSYHRVSIRIEFADKIRKIP